LEKGADINAKNVRARYRWFNSLEINEDEVYRLTIDEASRVILKNKNDIINAKCREKVKN
jgi:hypothetical protein